MVQQRFLFFISVSTTLSVVFYLFGLSWTDWPKLFWLFTGLFTYVLNVMWETIKAPLKRQTIGKFYWWHRKNFMLLDVSNRWRWLAQLLMKLLDIFTKNWFWKCFASEYNDFVMSEKVACHISSFEDGFIWWKSCY